ncbi:MAG: hypothetical protein K0S74_288 [Chlamydiales bacterium]|jgi:endonuclease/exonuclease/phosphatase family metal-dependent hydrolase|nr:hypothetical protein [Chlamydiales bacterium]
MMNCLNLSASKKQPYCCNRPEIANTRRYPFEKEDNLIRIVSANILYQKADLLLACNNLNYDWKIRKKKISRILANYKPDIIGLQEGDQGQTIDLLNWTNFWIKENYYSLVGCSASASQNSNSTHSSYRPNEEFISILYNCNRFELVNVESFWLHEGPDRSKPQPGFGGIFPRIVVNFQLQDLETKQLIYVYNTHFDHNTRNKCQVRYRSAQLLADVIESINAPNITTVTMGDFNLYPNQDNQRYDGEDAYRELRRTGIDIRDPQPESHIGPDGTFPGYKEDTHFAKGGAGARLDQMFVKNCKIVKEGVLADNWDPEHRITFFQNRDQDGSVVDIDKYPLPSDHHFLIADLEIGKEA